MSTAQPTAAPATRKTGELVGIQYLRGVAAMMVVVFHTYPQLQRMGYGGGWLPGLSSGVDIFFVISGFIMWVTTSGRAIGPVQFWRRRIVRIVPLYWLITTFMVVLMLVAPNALQTSVFDPYHVAASYLFVAVEHAIKPKMEPVLIPGWTLNYEMFFYLIFGGFLLAQPRLRLFGTIAVLAALVAIGAVVHAPHVSFVGFYTFDIMLEFAFGMLIGAAMTGSDAIGRIPAWAGSALAAAGLALALFLPFGPSLPIRSLARGLPGAAVVLGMLAIEVGRPLRDMRVPRLVGDASYSIYLSHVVTLSAASQAWRKLGLHELPGGWTLFAISSAVASAGVGVACYIWLEKPLIRLFRDRPRDGVAVRRTA